MKDRKKKIRVLSGIRASHSSLHLGNLLGAIHGMVELQNNSKYETFYMVADLHGITDPYKVEEMKRNRIEMAIDYLSAGIDPQRSTLFLQADVSEHTELAYLLSSVIKVKRIMILPSKKEEYKKNPEKQSVALLNYPVLMAADILAYKAGKVPIGLDQEAHLEVAREIARKINSMYGMNFPAPKRFSILAKNFTIPSILGEGKMSKSESGSAIFLSDSLEVIKKKVFKITTDKGKGSKIPVDGGVNVLFILIELFIGNSRRQEIEKRYITTGVKYSEIKQELAEAIYKKLKPIQEKRKYYENNPKLVRKILDDGAEKARKIARKTLNEVKEAMGLR